MQENTQHHNSSDWEESVQELGGSGEIRLSAQNWHPCRPLGLVFKTRLVSCLCEISFSPTTNTNSIILPIQFTVICMSIFYKNHSFLEREWQDLFKLLFFQRFPSRFFLSLALVIFNKIILLWHVNKNLQAGAWVVLCSM